MVTLTVNYCVHRTVNVKKKSVVTTVRSKRSVCCESSSKVVVHDNRHTEFFSTNCTLDHLVNVSSCSVKVVSFNFPSLSLRLVDSLSYEKETVTPTHEWL